MKNSIIFVADLRKIENLRDFDFFCKTLNMLKFREKFIKLLICNVNFGQQLQNISELLKL